MAKDMEVIQKLYFISPSQAYKNMTKLLRTKGAEELTQLLSVAVETYWTHYGQVHNPDCEKADKVQHWFYFLAYSQILKDYGWWDFKVSLPRDYTQEEPT